MDIVGTFGVCHECDAASAGRCVCLSASVLFRLVVGAGSTLDGIGRRGPSREMVGDGFGVVVEDGTPRDLDLVGCGVNVGGRIRLHSSSGRSKGSILVSFVEVGLVDVGRGCLGACLVCGGEGGGEVFKSIDRGVRSRVATDMSSRGGLGGSSGSGASCGMSGLLRLRILASRLDVERN